MARRLVVVAGVWTLTAVLVTAASVLAQPRVAVAQEGEVPAGEEPPRPDGPLLWRRDCASCHGPDAGGTAFAPSLQGVGPSGIEFVLTTGRMPLADLAQLHAEGIDPAELEVRRGPPAYTDAEIEALVDHTRGFIDGPDVPSVATGDADLARGQELYQATCAACHTWSGRGGALTDGHVAPSLVPSTPRQVVEAMRLGVGTMPAYDTSQISETDAEAIAAYVQELQQPVTSGHPLGFLGPVAEGFVAWAVGIVAILLAARWIGSRA